jgi:hypothetical protein
MNGARADEWQRAADELPGGRSDHGSMLTAQEQSMSEAKREQSRFHFAAAIDQTPVRARVRTAASRPTVTSEMLRLAEPWETGTTQGADPYNAVGTRAARSPRPRA